LVHARVGDFGLLLVHLQVFLQHVERDVDVDRIALPDLGPAVIHDPVVALALVGGEIGRSLVGGDSDDGELRPCGVQTRRPLDRAVGVLANADHARADDHPRPFRDVAARLRENLAIHLGHKREVE